MTVQLRRELPADVPVVDAVVRAASGADGDRVVRLMGALRSSHAWRDLSFVAESDGEVVGHVLLTGSWLDARRRHRRPAGASGVSRGARLRGAARARDRRAGVT